MKGRRLSPRTRHETITECGDIALLTLNFDYKRGERSATLVYFE